MHSLKKVLPCQLLILLALLLFSVWGWADTTTLVTSQSALGANDSTDWAQLGADGTVVPQGATATSAAGNTVTVFFDEYGGGVSGLTSVECPAAPSCSWTGGFTPGETLIWAYDGTNGSGALLTYFSNAVSGAGLSIQSDAPGAFTGEVQVLFTDNSVSTLYSVDSDADGDPLFLGITDNNGANIAAIGFDMINSGSDHDFAAGTLYSVNPSTSTPEPASLLLLGSGLAGMIWKKKFRA